MEIRPHDELLDQALIFAKNKQTFSSNSISNLYVAQEFDEQGNLLNTTFGSNVMTNYAMDRYFRQNDSFPTNFYLGSGTGAFTADNPNLSSPHADIVITGSTSDGNQSFACPLYFQPSEVEGEPGLITCICKYMTAVLPYTVTGYTNFTISEYGIGTSLDGKIWTHSHIYDNTGAISSITKTPNKQIVFTVYLCVSYTTSLIESCHASGIYPILTSLETFISTATDNNQFVPQYCGTFKADSLFISRDILSTVTSWESNVLTKQRNMKDMIIYNKAQSSSDAQKAAYLYTDGFLGYTSGFQIAERQTLTTPENIAFEEWFNPSHLTNDGLAYNFGKDAITNTYAIPITQIAFDKINHPEHGVYLYNYKTQAWDIPEDFDNDSLTWYNETLMECGYKRYHVANDNQSSITNIESLPSCKIYYRNGSGDIVTMYLHQNLDTQNPILAFNTTMSTIYATDAYWDTSTWTLITNPSSIPSNLRNKRYWITNSDYISDSGTVTYELMKPIRARSKLKLKPFDGVKRVNMQTIDRKTYQTCYNIEPVTVGTETDDTKGWFINKNVIYDITNASTTPTYTLLYDSKLNAVFTYGNWILAIYDSGAPAKTCSITDMSTLNRGNTTQFTTTSFGTYNVQLSNLYKTESETGLVCLSITSSPYTAAIIDMRNENQVTEHTLANTILACCINGTDLIASVDSSSTSSNSTIKVYDVDDLSTPINTFALTFRPTIMCSYTYLGISYIWAGAGTTDPAVCINVSTGSITTCNASFGNINKSTCHYTYSEDTFVVYYADGGGITTAKFVYIPNPTVIRSFSSGITNLTYNTNMKLSRINNNALVLLYQGDTTNSQSSTNQTSYVINMGTYINNSTYEFLQSFNKTLIPFGNYYFIDNEFIPIAYYLKHKIVGTTNTITTLNSQKRLSNKAWSTKVTNIGSYVPEGLPRGQESSL